MLQHAITPVGRPCAVSHAAVSPRTPPSPPPPHPRTYTSGGGGGGIMHGAARRDRGQLPLVTHRGARLALGGMRDTNGWSRRLSGLPEGASATLRRPSGEGSVFRGAHGGGSGYSVLSGLAIPVDVSHLSARKPGVEYAPPRRLRQPRPLPGRIGAVFSLG